MLAFFASPQGVALQAFASLIFLDLFTRWLAICYAKMKREGIPVEEIDLFRCMINIPGAMKSGDINSNHMKTRFLGKIIVYTLFVLVAIHTDSLLQTAGEVPIILKMSWIYLATTEGISILENLRDAGVDQAGTMLDIMKNRLATMVEKYKK
jgi:phage-related holin